MQIANVSMENYITGLATSQANGQVQAEITLAILKQQQEIQAMQAAALIHMINFNPLDGSGQMVNQSV